MLLSGTRFGQIELNEDRVITLASGLIGFPKDTRLVLLEGARDSRFAWLQSLVTPGHAFPVVDGATLATPYPEGTLEEAAAAAGLDYTDLAVLIVAAVRPNDTRAFGNLLAPILLDLTTRRGAQVVLDPRKHSPSSPLSLAPVVSSRPQPSSADYFGSLRAEAAK